MPSHQRIREHIARFQCGEISLTSEPDAEALIDNLRDADDWTAETFPELDHLRAIAQPAITQQGLVLFEEPTVVPGDLIIDGDLECQSHLLVVGNLHCTGYVYSGIHDSLIVAGDIAAAAIETLRSYWLVGGSITAQTTWLSSYGLLFLRGSLRTRLLVVQQHFDVRDALIEAQFRVDTDYLPNDAAAGDRLREVLTVNVCLDDQGQFDSFELLRRVARGENLFRQPVESK